MGPPFRLWGGTASLAVSDEDVQREIRRRYEKATLEYIAAPIDQSIPETKPSDAELETWYQANIDRFGKGEGRRLFYVLFDDAEVGERVQVSDPEIEEYYRSNSQQFERPERRRARHILIKVAPDADQAATDAARVKAEDLARQARGGADFGQLAAKFSDDPGSKDKGGDVGIFPRGQMVPEFEDVAFTLNAGVVSDPVKSQYGFHVIRVEEIQPGGAQPLAEVREQIKSQLRFPRLREAAGKLAQEFRTKAGDGAKFRPAADEMKLTVRDGGVVLRARGRGMGEAIDGRGEGAERPGKGF